VNGLPLLALSVRQPWAWAIIHAGKDIENRSAAAVRHMVPLRGRIAIHAAKGMTFYEYDDAHGYMKQMLGVQCPPPAELLRGGIIGSVDVIDVVSKSDSPWFCGPRGLVLRNPTPCEFIPAIGALGYFPWAPTSPEIVPQPARWMLPQAIEKSRAKTQSEPTLFDAREP
jgi:hypothetical protein